MVGRLVATVVPLSFEPTDHTFKENESQVLSLESKLFDTMKRYGGDCTTGRGVVEISRNWGQCLDRRTSKRKQYEETEEFERTSVPVPVPLSTDFISILISTDHLIS
jgi:hypothetical protein